MAHFNYKVALWFFYCFTLGNAMVYVYAPSIVEWPETNDYKTDIVYGFSVYYELGNEISFQLDNQSANTFTINSTGRPTSQNTTGAVYARHELLCNDSKTSYIITITSADNKHFSHSKSTTVQIVNGSFTHPSLHFGSPSSIVFLSENLMAPTYVTTLNVTGEGLSLPYYQSISLTLEDDYNGLFALDSIIANEYGKHAKLTTTRPLDYEEKNKYIVNVRARESIDATCAPFIQATVTLMVTDAEDEPPKFNTDQSFIVIPEDAALGATVVSLSAINRDRGIDNDITYSILAGDKSDWFAIEPSTGDLIVKKPLDREYLGNVVNDVQLSVMATEVIDGVGQAQNTPIEITIGLADVNDCAPKFSSPNYVAFVSRDAPIGSAIDFGVGVLSVSDLDTDDNATFEVSLSDVYRCFTITPTNGTGYQEFSINVMSENFGYEGDSKTTTIVLTAKDVKEPTTLYSTSTVTVSILDASDSTSEKPDV